MSKRESSKIVTIAGRQWQIDKFDALTGSYIAFTLAEKFLPMGLEAKAGLTNMPKGRELLSRQEFTQLQKNCLSVVSEVLSSGPRPVFNANGSWGVMEIEKDTQLVLLLTIHALAFNIAGFFDGEGLKELQTSLADIFPVRTQISAAGPTPRS